MSLTAYTVSAQTYYDKGSVAVYSLKDAPPASVAMNSPAPSVQSYPLSGDVSAYAPSSVSAQPLPLPIPQREAGPSASSFAPPATDTSYGANSLIIVGQSQQSGAVSTPPSPIISAPVPAQPAPVAAAAPSASPAEALLLNTKASLPPSTPSAKPPASYPVDDMTGGAVAASAAPASVMRQPAMTPFTDGRSAEKCEINQSMMQKMALLEKEKEALRRQTQSGSLGNLAPIAQCAAETTKIQSLEAEIAYLKEENDSLKRVSNEMVAASLPAANTAPQAKSAPEGAENQENTDAQDNQ